MCETAMPPMRGVDAQVEVGTTRDLVRIFENRRGAGLRERLGTNQGCIFDHVGTLAFAGCSGFANESRHASQPLAAPVNAPAATSEG